MHLRLILYPLLSWWREGDTPIPVFGGLPCTLNVCVYIETMPKNPYIHAVLASVYIVAVVLAINIGSHHAPPKDNILMPMAMLSLLVLSVCVMGYLFIFQPFQMYLSGNKKEAITFFVKTVGTFAVITAIIAAASFFVV